MVEQILKFFKSNLAEPTAASAQDNQHALNLAAAALLIEVMQADYQQQDQELATVHQTLERCLNIRHEELLELVELAQAEVKEATSVYQFTRLIHDNYSPEQKYQLLLAMWQVAFADGEIDKYEDHIIRKVSELLYISHSDFIRAKQQAKSASAN